MKKGGYSPMTACILRRKAGRQAMHQDGNTKLARFLLDFGALF